MLLIIQHVKHIDGRSRGYLLLRVFLPFCLDDGCSLGRIGDVGQSAIVQSISYFDTNMRISDYVLVPAPAVRVREPRPINRGEVELPVIRNTISRYRVWKQIPGAGLNIRRFKFVAEGPV